MTVWLRLHLYPMFANRGACPDLGHPRYPPLNAFAQEHSLKTTRLIHVNIVNADEKAGKEAE